MNPRNPGTVPVEPAAAGHLAKESFILLFDEVLLANSTLYRRSCASDWWNPLFTGSDLDFAQEPVEAVDIVFFIHR